MEGVIETMNEGAEKIFGYKKEELIGIKRVSIFSPGEIVLQNVANWLDTAVKNGIYEGETIFLNKNKEKINAKIRITPTFKNGKSESFLSFGAFLAFKSQFSNAKTTASPRSSTCINSLNGEPEPQQVTVEDEFFTAS